MKELIQKHKVIIAIVVSFSLLAVYQFIVLIKMSAEAQKPSQIEQVFIDVKDSRERRIERNKLIATLQELITILQELNRQDAEIADNGKKQITDLLINGN